VGQHEADAGLRTDRSTTVDSEELRRLRKGNAKLKRTNEILKLASACFALEARRRTRPPDQLPTRRQRPG